MSGSSRVDWELAAATGRRLVRPAPAISSYTRDRAAAELIDCAARAEGYVRDHTGLTAGPPAPSAQVLDRKQWVSAATVSMAALLDEPTALPDPGPGLRGRLGGIARGVGAGAAGVQAGAVFAFVAGAILGQYDPFAGDGGAGDGAADGAAGRLLLVGENVVAVERALDLTPSDFRMWVCLHEMTHNVQFAANPWLADFMRENVARLTVPGADTAPDSGASNTVGDLASRLAKALATPAADRPGGVLGALSVLQAPDQYAAVENLLMLGTLLEGHADHVMDTAGPAVVPSVQRIRRAFDARRSGPRNPVQRVLRALLGMDAKIEQYVRGKAFVDAVVGKVGMARFNAVWTSAQTLPQRADLADPDRWINRVL